MRLFCQCDLLTFFPSDWIRALAESQLETYFDSNTRA